MFRIAIVEDEAIYIKQLKEYLEQYGRNQGEQFSITVFQDGDGITAGYKAQFDMILMDIEMKFMDGMSAAEEIRRMDEEVVIIFITNMTSYAIRGYQVDALDYVLKPVTYFTFSQKLNKALGRIKSRKTYYLSVPVKGGVQKIDINALLYVESQRHVLMYHTDREVLSIRGNISEMENILEPYGFFRCNKGYLVNMKFVDTIQESSCVMGGEILPVSRGRKRLFLEALTKYISEVV